MREIIMSIMLAVIFYALVMEIAECFTLGLTGISESDAEDEPIESADEPVISGLNVLPANSVKEGKSKDEM